MKKRIVSIAAAVLILSLLILSGCSGGGLTIAVPNDTTNEARALLLLEDLGLIQLK